MIKGKCPQCGTYYYGWALSFPRNQYCNHCGVGLEITDDEKTIKGYSPFEAEELTLNPERSVPPEKTKNIKKN